MIKLDNLTKKYGDKTVVNQLSLTLKPGVVTGLLGPNGSGKSTTMKMIISLVHPTFGNVTVGEKKYSDLLKPTAKIGTLIDPSAVDNNLTARQHLSLISTAANINKSRVDKMLKITGLEMAQNKKIKDYSLGMKQRLGIATALMGNPETVILDEPFNGLDVDGIKWLRKLFNQLAAEGKAVIVSSHLMSEIQAVADRIIIIGQGKLLADMTMEEMNKKSLSSYIYVKTNNIDKMSRVLTENQAMVQQLNQGLEVRNIEAREGGQLAYDHHIVVYELKEVQPTLEELFTEITYGKVDYVSQGVENK
ncbi:ABC transporter ATP-binding protein [Pseudogracilibacillus auburnensis]|uniref:ABC-2 type transport system ATP-binding protein n=1 Tax=Pseudogracilibacillus auburnensis TaxID=1494959 RepID=A0A2V3WAG0_9BACI|nr:ATP-binding cassette domain-containing protein [Pseudogracilibacillus auburnensis]PXW90516.1 ABC-2 type transport system ATP-binding protein [Pseudogracilibacillus auburnensis]